MSKYKTVKTLINSLKEDIQISKVEQQQMEHAVNKLFERQNSTNERIDRKMQVLCDEIEKRCEIDKDAA